MIIQEDPLLVHSLENGLPTEVAVGEGNALFVSGWAFHRRRRIVDLSVEVAGRRPQPLIHGMPRADVFRFNPAPDPHGRYAYRSGYWGFASFEHADAGRQTDVRLVATLESGVLSTRTIGSVAVHAPPQLTDGPRPATAGEEEPLIAICMTTFNPDPQLFRAQIASIRAQTHRAWICMVSDDHSAPGSLAMIEAELAGDERFRLSQPATRLGFYRNFERALELVPDEAELVALSDQDDRWYPEKLEALRARLRPGVNLAYGDLRVVGAGGEVISETLFRGRRNNHTNLASLMIGNTITGAASLFPRGLLDLALPFPQHLAHDFHDQWLALVALATGRIEYVKEPIQDYVQHDANAFGVAGATWRRQRPHLVVPNRAAASQMLLRWRHEYHTYARPLQLRAKVLLLRVEEFSRGRSRRAVRRLAALDGSWRTPGVLAWLFARSLVARWRRAPTMGNERLVVRGVVWRNFVKLQSLLRRRRRGVHGQALPAPPPPTLENREDERPVVMRQLDSKLVPIRLEVRGSAPPRVNMLIPTVDLEHFFGAYIGKFNLARRLAATGLRVRLVATDPTDLPSDWRARVESYEGLSGLMDEVELVHSGARDALSLEVSPDDRFVATTSWTAHLAHAAARELGRERFMFVVQEYDALTYPVGTLGAVVREAYTHPHVAVFSTELLRGFFRQRGIGVYEAGEAEGDASSTSFRNAISQVDAPSADDLRRRPRSLLFYARPEQHAERNLFELGMLALERAVRRGTLTPDWRLVGIGAQEPRSFRLSGGQELTVLPRSGQDDYRELLGQHSVGLALMDTPHPSLVPLEMASAGMLVVTTTFANKTPEAIRAISPNLIGVEPTAGSIADGLARAVGRLDEVQQRADGARFDWPRKWSDTFDEPTVTRIRELLDRT